MRYWQTEAALEHITPPGCPEPEGWNVHGWLRDRFGADDLGWAPSVLDFGCGVGRLASAFTPEQYLGVDVNEHAVRKAQREHPRHAFLCQPTPVAALPRTRVALAWTVLLHVGDEDIEATCRELTRAAGQVWVAEILGRRWRRGGNPPVFNRDLEDYRSLFPGLEVVEEFPCTRYPGSNYTIMATVEAS